MYVPGVLQYHYVDRKRLTLSYVIRKAYQRARTGVLSQGRCTGIPLYQWRKLSQYLLALAFAFGGARFRFFVVGSRQLLEKLPGNGLQNGPPRPVRTKNAATVYTLAPLAFLLPAACRQPFVTEQIKRTDRHRGRPFRWCISLHCRTGNQINRRLYANWTSTQRGDPGHTAATPYLPLSVCFLCVCAPIHPCGRWGSLIFFPGRDSGVDPSLWNKPGSGNDVSIGVDRSAVQPASVVAASQYRGFL